MSLRLSGSFLFVGGIGSALAALFIYAVPGPDGINGITSLLSIVTGIVGALFVLVGLPALQRAQPEKMGRLGWSGVALLWFSAVMGGLVLTGVQVLDYVAPQIDRHSGGPPAPAYISGGLAALSLLIGGVIVGIQLNRSRGFPAAIGWLLIVGAGGQGLTVLLSSNLGVALNSVLTAMPYAGLAWAGAILAFRGAATPAATASVRRR